jgi:rare lipoprotein A (peptidoglycan hydrolase)
LGVNTKSLVSILILAAILGSGCAHQQPSVPPHRPTATPEPAKKGATEEGLASWFGEPYHGRRTASGEIYDMHEMTAAHRTLPFGTTVKVTRRDTGGDVKVRITDRGPFIKGRIIDLSFAAAKKINLDIDGVAPVKVVVVGWQEPPKKKAKEKNRAAKHPKGENCLKGARHLFAELPRRGGDQLSVGVVESPGGMRILDHEVAARYPATPL